MTEDKKKPSNTPTTRVNRRDVWFNKEADDILNALPGNATDYINRAVIAYWHLSEGEKVPIMSREAVKQLALEITRQMKRDEKPKGNYPTKQYAFNNLEEIGFISLSPKDPADLNWHTQITETLKTFWMEPFAVITTVFVDPNQITVMVPVVLIAYWEALAEKSNSILKRLNGCPEYKSYVSTDGKKHTFVEAGNEGGMICWAVFPHLSPLI